MNASLVAMSGPSDIKLENLSNFEAGLAFLGVINQVYPGIRFSQLADLAEGRTEVMNGWLSNLNPMNAVRSVSKTIGDAKDGIGDILKDTFTTVGSGAGDTLRLATDEKVLDGAFRLYEAYQTKGMSESSIMDFVNGLGATTKEKAAAAAGGLPGGILPWALGGGGLLLVVMLMGKR
jgi:hypothetical protein